MASDAAKAKLAAMVPSWGRGLDGDPGCSPTSARARTPRWGSRRRSRGPYAHSHHAERRACGDFRSAKRPTPSSPVHRHAELAAEPRAAGRDLVDAAHREGRRPVRRNRRHRRRDAHRARHGAPSSESRWYVIPGAGCSAFAVHPKSAPVEGHRLRVVAGERFEPRRGAVGPAVAVEAVFGAAPRARSSRRRGR